MAGILALVLFELTVPASGGAIRDDGPARAGASSHASDSDGVLPCKRRLALTAIFRADGRIRFEGVADPSLRGEQVRVYEIRRDQLVATTRVRRDGTWWGDSTTKGKRYTWLSMFVAEAGPAQSRWRRLGQAVGIRDRKPVASRGRAGSGIERTTIRVKVSGESRDRLIVGIQTGCSRYEVDDRFRLDTNKAGVATITFPRPEAGDAYAIYRVRTDDGWKISPPIVVKPSIQG